MPNVWGALQCCQHASIYNLPRNRRVGRPLSQIFKRPRITQTSTMTKNVENQTKRKDLKILKLKGIQVSKCNFSQVHENWGIQCSYFIVTMVLYCKEMSAICLPVLHEHCNYEVQNNISLAYNTKINNCVHQKQETSKWRNL